jgi:hypothetical protein
MELEAQTVIDVEAQPIDSSFPESNEQWYSAQQMMNLLRLSKTDLQKSIFDICLTIFQYDFQNCKTELSAVGAFLQQQNSHCHWVS